jgi:hypothetical protein
MGTLTAAMTFRLAPRDALSKGFGNIGIITVAALFPVAARMYSTGAISMVPERLTGRPRTLVGAQVKILPPGPPARFLTVNSLDSSRVCGQPCGWEQVPAAE